MTEGLYGEVVDGLERREHSAERLLWLLSVAVGTERLTAGWDGEAGDSSLGCGEGVCHDMVARSNDTWAEETPAGVEEPRWDEDVWQIC